ncbi:hypothetical protein DPM19_08405 [Actinomadura craniellae]|uniref:Uncharacterized protein n=1 Tax=Actinomadura craniellae TaxID=2231787 RepID=A0A365H9G2_9ACTN|nr:hypothetical protein [Actinomadura craniellae]RAY15784.1 hypothetical protein DPM19_08405 [Actinomadura craniellae]
MSDLGRVLRADARRTALVFAVPILALAGVATAWQATLAGLPGVAYWDNTVVALASAVRLLGPCAAALAAWVAVREHRLDYLRGLTPRSPAIGPLLDLMLLTGVALAAYGVVALVTVCDTLLREGAGRPHPLGIVAGAAALAPHVVLGYLCGRIAPFPMVVLPVAGAAGLWTALRGGGWWSLLPPAAIRPVELFTGLRTRVLADQTLWALGLAATLTLAYVWTLTRRRTLAVPLAVAVAVTAISTVRLEASGGSAVVPAPIDHVCREWPLTVCVHPALRPALPALDAAMTPLAARLAGTPGAFSRVEQRPVGEPARIWRGVAYIRVPDLSPGFEWRAVRELRASLIDAQSCAEPHRRHGAAYRGLVDAWLLDERAPEMFDAETARRFGSWSERERRLWLRLNYADYRRCTLVRQSFGG